ncbi:MAG: hypothetical protein GY796_35100 [Chloroflexi bacterium]|nr:hypothetical protein [Chloroflexota bacterium]
MKTWPKSIFIIILAILFAACSAQEPEIVEVTRIIEVEAEPVEVTRIVEVEAAVPVEVTRIVEVEAEPVEVEVEVEVTRIVEMPAELIIAPETAVTTLPLAAPLDDRNAEISGMAWYDDYLIILPQYPNFNVEDSDGFIYAIHADDINAYLFDDSNGPLEATPIPFSAPGLQDSIEGFEGYEAIAFIDDQAYLTIEVETDDGMFGYLVSGAMDPELGELAIDTDAMTRIDAQADVGNMSEETLFVAGDSLVTLYEANGAGVTTAPIGHVFDTSLAKTGTVPLVNIEYRLTDATELDSNGRFWTINYFFPGDSDLATDSDPIVDTWGEGATHLGNDGVERLIELQYSADGISLVNAPPTQIYLLPDGLRNWEGLVRLDNRGLLIATDKWPRTTLGFVPFSARAGTDGSAPDETALNIIPLEGDTADRNVEFSGMAWYGDHLIMLPQYPNFNVEEGDGFIYAIPKEQLEAYISGDGSDPLTPTPIPFSADGLQDSIDGFEGYEAIDFIGDDAYITIEVENDDEVFAYVVKGTIASDLSELTVDTSTMTRVDSPTGISNFSEETLIVTGDNSFITLYEANGAGVNEAPMAHTFDANLAETGAIPFPNIEYRVTDATALDADGRFWAINYMFPGDRDILTDSDPLADVYGEGPTHVGSDGVERLVQFQYSADGVTLTDAPPIQLELLSGGLRNLEGIVRLDDIGFLVVTDKWPQTIFGFVPLPEGGE